MINNTLNGSKMHEKARTQPDWYQDKAKKEKERKRFTLYRDKIKRKMRNYQNKNSYDKAWNFKKLDKKK